jgi:hypothetical protein
MPRKEAIRATITALLAVGALVVLVFVGSRKLQHFDAALFAYLFATVFAVFGIVYRYSMWLQRPPTARYWKRGWQMFFRPRNPLPNLALLGNRLVKRFVVNDFIWKRSWNRGLAHSLIMWGCLMAFAITFPLVFGWINFQTVDDRFEHYQIVLFGFPTITIPVESLLAKLIFHGLVWSSFIVIAGVMLAFRRRMREHGAAAVQRFGEDILPLVMLFAISVTGLLIWVSYGWMHGYAYSFLAILHAITVIMFLLWLPFGKLFHIFQRPAQLGVSFYKDAGLAGERACCGRCGADYASKIHIEDLITVEQELGYHFELPESDKSGVDHYQRICPKCRRTLFALAQGGLWTYGQEPEQTQEKVTHG